MMKNISYFLLTIVLFIASFGAQASDSTSTERYYYKKSRVQQMANLLDQQIRQNAWLPKAAKNYLIDGRQKHYGQPTFDATTQDQLRKRLQIIQEDTQVEFYIIIPPPLLLNEFIQADTTIQGKKQVKLIKEDSSKLYKQSMAAIQQFTQDVFKRSELSNARRKGLLLNLDSFIKISDKKKSTIVEEIQNATLLKDNVYPVELFYPCLVFGQRINVETIKKGVAAIRKSTYKNKISSSGQSGKIFFDYRQTAYLTKEYVATLEKFIKEEGKDFTKEDNVVTQFQSTLRAQLTNMPFSKK
ncbi:hypothetical protein, partial [uncultured Microscilla sp.]|uniref:hypothetical protein n=1 Tax=uncultured Microscilla sp. TaxID=432653 RepID=UPI00261B26D6